MRTLLVALGLAALAGCGLDGPPERPDPAPREEAGTDTPQSRVTIGGSGYIGVSGSR